MQGINEILVAARAARRMADRYTVDPGPFIEWLPGQHALHTCPDRRKLLRAGNQAHGKTWAGLKEIAWWLEGTHPHLKTKRPPIEAWIVCDSWKQSQTIMCKFYMLVDKRALHPRDLGRFIAGEGWPAGNPIVRFRNGSILRFKTANQNPKALASGTVHVVLADEPQESRVYTELERRLTRTGGTMILTLTPVNCPVEYLRKLCEDRVVTDLHYRLEAKHLIPVGGAVHAFTEAGEPMDAAWVAEQERVTLEHEAPVVLHGEWESRGGGAVFRRFTRKDHVTEDYPKDANGDVLDLLICLGIDHGSRAFKQTILLVGVKIPSRLDVFSHPSVHVLAEYCDVDGLSKPEDDARGLLDLLKLYGWSYNPRDLYQVRGDIPHSAGRIRGPIGDKSNVELQAEIAREMTRRGTPTSVRRVRPPIRRVKTGAGGGRGSVYRGCTWLHRCMLRPGHFTIHPRCERLIEAIETWDNTASTEDYKDPIDALRYAVWQWAMRGSYGGSGRSTLYVG